MNQKRLQRLCDKWQKVLHLSDWKVAVRFVMASALSTRECYATTYISPGLKRAEVLIRDPLDFHEDGSVWGENDVEQTVVHELLHLHLNGLMPMSEDEVRKNIVEQAIESIAWALVEMERSK